MYGQRDLTQIPDPDPEIERRSFQVADGFEVNLFAADPLLAKPIQMNFDPAGRLWVATSEVYPQIKPGQKANDKIIILEDRHQTGRADQTTVFADGLLIPTGVEPGDGGAYVANSTDLLHLADTKGTGRADRRRIVLSGFGTEDTHHIIHTLRWGPDGMLYFNQSTYIHSHIETPHGVRRLGGGGIWQFRPETMQLEVFLHGLINPWGHHFDRWGQSFATDGAGGEGINYVLPGASYAWTPGASRILHGLNPGSPKHCGAEILSGRHLPEEWQGNILTNDFRGHRVCRFVLREDGAGFAAQEKPELIKTNHPAFRPVDIKMGPDGAIYIADWYNPIIQHGEVDFRDPRRDLTHGRIWRVTAKGRPLVPRPELVGATTEKLLQALTAPEDWTRQQAKRVLKERGAKVLPALAAWVQTLNRVDRDYEHQLLEALWTYQALDVAEPTLLNTLLHAHDARARAAAMRVLKAWHTRLPNATELFAAGVVDEHPRVRLEAIRALGEIPDAHAMTLALRAIDRPMDLYLEYALWLTARELEPEWMPALQKGRLDFAGNTRHLLFALQAVATGEGVKPLAELIQSGRIPKESLESVFALLAAVGGREELRLVLEHVLRMGKGQAGQQTALLAALEQAGRQRNVRPAGELNRIAKFLTAENEPLRAAAVRLVGVWRLESFRPQLLGYARADQTSDLLRRAAFDGLTQLGGPASREVFNQLAGPPHPPELRQLAIAALATTNVESAAPRAAEFLTEIRGDTDPTEVVTAFLQRKGGAAALAKALTNRRIAADVAKIGVRVVRASGQEMPALVEAMTNAGGLTGGPRTLTAKEIEELATEVAQRGNAVRGETIFRRKDLACLKCHSIAGAGGQVGPDLISIGAAAPVDYLIESILLPNKIIKENYHSLIVATRDGRVFTGIKVRETESELILRDGEDREVTVPIKAIEEKTTGGSLMPEGLADALTRAELVDLVRFLSELGKVGPLAVSKSRLIRRWQVLEPTPAARQALEGNRWSAVDADGALVWSPAYATVAGVLPRDALLPLRNHSGEIATIRCHLQASSPGKVRLRLNSAEGLELRLDRTPVEMTGEVLLDLAPGIHRLTFTINLTQRRDGLRCELDDVPGSAAQVQIVTGK
ncbi:MAG TPA: PVC-type heme-binding CxxCH protein [Gemmataceae bacterium]|nr:PVC-type heme-binding CxxCH protein [Gemmataceae bacterium]